MPFCPKCGKEVLYTDRFCLNCGQVLGQMAPSFAASPTQTPSTQPSSAIRGPKNPWLAAILNFFFPGIGYIYNGAGRSTSQTIFGVMIFIFYYVGFIVAFIGAVLFPTTISSSGGVSPSEVLSLLLFLLPIAFAYDGYQRAKSS